MSFSSGTPPEHFLLQDLDRGLSQWFASRIDARYQLRAHLPVGSLISGTNMNGYVVFYGSKSTKVYAHTSMEAHDKGVAFFRVSAAKAHLVSAHLVEVPTGLVSQVLS